ncbi:MAG TPA: L-seryl-tRNA(Sec) selenium transferase [Steroidobacteraceae bacterium]|nr:L-seryl-tRNA(Sec) selenium transferase [Steroidobacteraceae bacterium]
MKSGAAAIPSVDRLLSQPALGPLLASHGRSQVIAALRAHLDDLRQAALAGALNPAFLGEERVAAALEARLGANVPAHLRPVFNLTGTVLHTNLGRALLPEESLRCVVQAMRMPVNLEYDLDTGRRGERDSAVEALLCELTGAEAATIVNNNAAGVLLMLSALAARREVIVSRGELVEIGGSFRVPDIMRQAGARLVEVGTTNRTHAADYAAAAGPRTALIMKVHTSNYVIQGFTSSVGLTELAELGRSHSVPVVVDLGSGSLVDLSRWGLPAEPTVRGTLAAGADLASFSADKLLGGPQAGIVVGRRDLVAKLKKHPLKRALRVSKLTLAALEPVLTLYRAPEFLAERLTTLRLLTRDAAAMREQALRLQPIVQQAVGPAFAVEASAMHSQIGSGALPLDQLPSHGLVIRPAAGKRGGLDRLEKLLRGLPRPVLGRLADKALWLDLRCLEPLDEPEFSSQWRGLGP